MYTKIFKIANKFERLVKNANIKEMLGEFVVHQTRVGELIVRKPPGRGIELGAMGGGRSVVTLHVELMSARKLERAKEWKRALEEAEELVGEDYERLQKIVDDRLLSALSSRAFDAGYYGAKQSASAKETAQAAEAEIDQIIAEILEPPVGGSDDLEEPEPATEKDPTLEGWHELEVELEEFKRKREEQ